MMIIRRPGAAGLSYRAVYPPGYSATYVKATSYFDSNLYPHFACNPGLSLTGGWVSNAWLTPNGTYTNQRFHIDLGAPKVVARIYYENSHNSGASTNTGAKNFTFWGSNSAAAFAELTYNIDTNWTQLNPASTQFVEHVAANQADPHYIVVNPPGTYRYYAFKIENAWGTNLYMGLRRIVLQV